MAVQYARAMGLHPIAIDGGAEKEKMCKELGAVAYVDFMTSKNIVEDVKKVTPEGYGPEAVILLAVNEKPFQQAAEYVRPKGTIVCIGLPANAFFRASVFDTVTRYVVLLPSPTSRFPPHCPQRRVCTARGQPY